MDIKGIKDSANVTLKRKGKDGVSKTVLYADYCNETSFDIKSNAVYATKKGVKKISWITSTDGILKLSAEVFDLKWIPILLGSDFKEGIQNVLTREVLTIENGKVELKDTPKDGTLELFVLGRDLISHEKELVEGQITNPDTYGITLKTIDFNSGSQPDGTKVVAFYLPTTMPNGKSFKVKASCEPSSYEIYGDTHVRDEDGIDKFFHFYVPNAKPKSELQLTMSAANVTKLDMQFDLLEGVFSSGEKGILDISVVE
ncbi:hypothetical protein KQI86_03955 [Clostridium sp. MSJ-11]|uniref:Uncharacterized protein n=1 Tax=Clostridium mobile TaxID=2841512 RepID=A0ABS6EEN2_9CLOT|nr:hypothetical protein [Clostridium mobile]MBU5483470.1 hypothetical protein [Clostridium mobile]